MFLLTEGLAEDLGRRLTHTPSLSFRIHHLLSCYHQKYHSYDADHYSHQQMGVHQNFHSQPE